VACGVCHSVHGQGGGWVRSSTGAGANGVESLLRNIVTPNAAMEAGYRRFRVETRDGEVQEGLLASQDDQCDCAAPTEQRRPSHPAQQRQARGFYPNVHYARGLLEGLKPEDVSDLFAYLKALK